MLFKKKYIAVFLLKEQGVYSISGMKRLRTIKDTLIISFKGNPYEFNITKPSYRKRMKLFYYFDMSENKQLHFHKQTSTFDPETVDKLENKKVVFQLVSGLDTPKFKMNIFYIMIGLLMGVSIGIIIGGYLP